MRSQTAVSLCWPFPQFSCPRAVSSLNREAIDDTKVKKDLVIYWLVEIIGVCNSEARCWKRVHTLSERTNDTLDCTHLCIFSSSCEVHPLNPNGAKGFLLIPPLGNLCKGSHPVAEQRWHTKAKLCLSFSNARTRTFLVGLPRSYLLLRGTNRALNLFHCVPSDPLLVPMFS